MKFLPGHPWWQSQQSRCLTEVAAMFWKFYKMLVDSKREPYGLIGWDPDALILDLKNYDIVLKMWK